MTAAELRTLRESLGLPASWLATQCQVTLRTVQHWESERNSVPAKAGALLQQLDQSFEIAVKETVNLANEKSIQNITLWRYKNDASLWEGRPDMAGLPVSCHAVLLTRTRIALEAAGYTVKIDYKPLEFNIMLP